VSARKTGLYGAYALVPLECVNECNKLAGQLGQPAVSRTKQEQISRWSILVDRGSAGRRDRARANLREPPIAKIEIPKMAEALKGRLGWFGQYDAPEAEAEIGGALHLPIRGARTQQKCYGRQRKYRAFHGVC
jgi:hypothetical protein